MRILLVEDEQKLATAIQRALELQQYVVDTAHDGKVGLDFALGESYDVIILDVMLLFLSGFDMCKKIREAQIHTPILLLTAKGQVQDKVLGLDNGADDYMVKPFSLDELFARIRALIRRPIKTTAEVLTCDDLTLNTVDFMVKRNKTTIRLSKKEFSMLEYLLRYKGTIITKEQLIAHVWNYDSNILPNSVEVHMKNLRSKIDRNGEPSIIKTMRGYGYIIEKDQY